MMNQNIRRLLDRLNLFRRLSDVEVAQLTILKQSDDSLKRMSNIIGVFDEQTSRVDDALKRMESNMGLFEERMENIERIELILHDVVSLKPSVDLDMVADLNRVV